MFSLRSIFLRFKWRISLTLALVLLESVLEILYPLCIGMAINSLLEGSHQGLLVLAILGLFSTILGCLRRFYDTRIYSGIYQTIAPEMVARERQQHNSVSKITGRAGLLLEFVEFLENSLPGLISTAINIVGVLLIISALNTDVLLACIGVLLVAVLTYTLTGHLNFRFNANYNNEIERRVWSIEQNKTAFVQDHFRQLMHWNIKLSDLETANYFVIFLAIVALLVFAPMSAVNNGVSNYGLILSLLMYVLTYIESVANLPLFVQQMIRLKEISMRLDQADSISLSNEY